MTRICSKCKYENQDDYDYCAKCGTPLVEGLQPRNIRIINADPQVNKKAILISYIITIFLSWSGFIINMFSKHSNLGFFTFFGLFLPFYLIQAPIWEIKKHGYIQLFIALVGVSLSFYVMLH